MNALPHEPGGLLTQYAEATLGNLSDPVTTSALFTNSVSITPGASATVVGTNQATGAAVAVTENGSVTQVSGAPPFSSTVSVLPSTPSATPTGLTTVSTTIGPGVATVPSFTLVTDNTPPPEKKCASIPAPIVISCPPGFEPVGTGGCLEVSPTSFDTGGRIDPPNSGLLVATQPGGCGQDNRQWYKNNECPINSQQIDQVSFRGDAYYLCESAQPLPPGIGCNWKYGELQENCTLIDRCEFGTNYTLEILSDYLTPPSITDLTEDGLVIIEGTQSAGPTTGDGATTAARLMYACGPSRTGAVSLTYRLVNIRVQAVFQLTPVRALGFIIEQNGRYWETSLGNAAFACGITSGSFGFATDCTVNTTATKVAGDFAAVYPKRDTQPLPTGFPAHPDFSQPFSVGVFVGRIVGDNYPTNPLSFYSLEMPSGSEVQFNYA